MKNDLTAIVLAGGIGKRFWPMKCDKTLFPFFQKSFFEYSVCSTLPKAVKRVVIVTNAMNNAYISKLSFPVPVTTVLQSRATGMADALLSAGSEIQNSSLLIMNADDLYDMSLYDGVVEMGMSDNAFGVIPSFVTQVYRPMGYIKTEGNAVVEIVEKPQPGNEPGNKIALLGHYIQDSTVLLDELRHTRSDADDVYEKTLSHLMKKYPFREYPYTKDLATLKYPWQILDVMEILLKGLKPYKGNNIQIKQNVIIEGPVYIDDNVKIFENTKIIGPCYIGKNTVIGNNNLIRQCHIGENCVTGFNTDLTRSYIGNDCWFHSNYVGDSVLEGNVSMGAGATCANLRLDDGEIFSITQEVLKTGTNRNKLGGIIGKDVRIGVHACIMPGVKIGSNTCIGAGSIISRDIPEDCFCKEEHTYKIVKNQKLIAGGNRDAFKNTL